MMDIKFRAYSKYDLSMDEVIEIDFDEETVIIQFEDEDFLDGSLKIATLGFDDIELMQYTGLKDKNGVQIYEGDVIKADDITFRIEFLGGCFCGVNDRYLYTLAKINSSSDIEIIGNIYQKKEK